jgi:hypothetical protein
MLAQGELGQLFVRSHAIIHVLTNYSVGVPTITTNGGAPGTGILWIPDVDSGLRAYMAVPQVWPYNTRC